MSSKLIIGYPSKNDLSNQTAIVLKHLLLKTNKENNIKCKIESGINLDFKKREEIYEYLDSLSEKIIDELKDQLNNIHKVSFNFKDWKIILSPWLKNFLKITYLRYSNIIEIFKKNEIKEVEIFECDEEKFLPIDNMELNGLANDYDWNVIMYSKIVSFINKDATLIKNKINFQYSKNENKSPKSIKLILIDLIRSFLSFFQKENDALIINPYLPKFENFKLNLLLKQVPQIWKFVRIQNREYSLILRKKINFLNSDDNFETFVKKIIPSSIPSVHMESFDELNKIIMNLNLPEKPKLIFTSNNYEYDEVFKLYTVLKKNIKCPYIIGQHGNYLSNAENKFFKKSHQADYYLDWGKKGFYDQDGFNFKLINKSIKSKKKDKILILDSPFGTDNKIFNRLEENEIKEKFLHNLLSLLDKKLHSKIVLRLHNSYNKKGEKYLSYIKSISPYIHIESHKKDIFDLFSKCKCVIHTYNSTAIYESMGLDIPTLCIWPSHTTHIEEKYNIFYDNLKKNNILFFEPSNLANTINNNFHDITTWWNQPAVINAKKLFLNEFSNPPPKKSIKLLKEKLIELNKYQKG